MDLHTPLPSLRPLEIKRIEHAGDAYFQIRDPLELGDCGPLLISTAVAPLLALLDGSHTLAAIVTALRLQAGWDVEAGDVLGFVGQLSEACLLEDERSTAARAAALAAYHAAPFRPPAHADAVYPSDPAALRTQLRAFERQVERLGAAGNSVASADGITGVISPHIDYARGGLVYARLWRAAQEAARAAEVVVIFGTDHSGGPNRITLSRQDYATPWGPLPTDRAAREAVANALGEAAFEEELHHRGEHSIELAAVWLHHARDGEPLPVVPVLCGHPGDYMRAGGIDPATPAGRAVAALRGALAGRRLLAVAAADLAHVGPAFGDPAPFGPREKGIVRAADEELLAACGKGAGAVLQSAGRVDDQFRICGLAPIACLLELVGRATAETVAYDQCAADDDGGSIVSIAGVLLRKDA